MGWPEMQTAIERLADAMTKDQREQRRYEIARDVMAAAISADWETDLCTWDRLTAMSVKAADALLAELERTDGD